MATYHVTVGRREYRVEIQPGQYTVNDRPLNMQLQRLNEYGLYLAKGDKHRLEMLLKPGKAGQVSVVVNQRHLMVRVEKNPSKLRNSEVSHHQNQITAPMPGVVVRLLAASGQHVKVGDLILIIESMKMQMEIRSPLEGKVEKLNKQAGEKVDKGEVLAIIHPSDRKGS